jgi:signal transduction histidine kinase
MLALEKRNARKDIVCIILAEFMDNAVWARAFAFPNEIEGYLVGSSTITFYHQVPVCKSKKLLVFVLFKYILKWLWWKTSVGQFSYNTLSSGFCIIASAVVIFMTQYYKNISSFERFSYMKKLEVLERKLNIVICTIPEGLMVILNTSKLLELYNPFIETFFDTHDSFEILTQLKDLTVKSPDNRTQNLFISITEQFENNSEDTINFGTSEKDACIFAWQGKRLMWGDQMGLLVMCKDITDLVTLEHIKAELKWKTLLIRSISHELRTPANSLVGLTEELKNADLTQQETKEYLEIISISSQNLLHIINDLIDYSQILAENIKISKKEFEIVRVLNKAFELIQMKSHSKGITTRMLLDPCLPHKIISDEKRLLQILVNLLNNSLRFTVSGSIKLIAVMKDNYRMKFIVEDTGLGIPENKQIYLASIIQENTPRNCTIEAYSDYIFGIQIANLLVKKLGGSHLKFKSQYLRGSNFYFILPITEIINRHDLSPIDTSIRFSEYELDEGGYRHPNRCLVTNSSFTDQVCPQVLLVDDSSFNRSTVAAILRKEFITFEECSDGNEAIIKVQSQDSRNQMYKIILMDCDMPILDGWKSTKKLHKLKQSGHIKNLPRIYAYTCFTSEEDIDRCYRVGMEGYLEKPVKAEVLIALVRKHL